MNMEKETKLLIILVLITAALMVSAAMVEAGSCWVCIEDYGDCEVVGERYYIQPAGQGKLTILRVLGPSYPYHWNGRETLRLQGMSIQWQWNTGAGPYWVHSVQHDAHRSDFCGPGGSSGGGSGGSGGPRPVALPRKQWYLTYRAHGVWCGVFVRTPIVDIAEWELCLLGQPPESVSDFCMNPNYADLPGCLVKDAWVIRLWELIR